MEFLDVPFYNDDFIKLGVRFLLNGFFLAIIVRYAICRSPIDREFVFTAVMMNITVFFICFTLQKLDLGLGAALGLFAIFGVLRYRTDTIRTKEMTYLFIVIGIAVINALSNQSTSYAELLAMNSAIFASSLLKEQFVARGHALESLTNRKKQIKHTLDYDKLELLAPARQAELLADLRQRTGIDVLRVQVRNIDLHNATAVLAVWYDEPNGDSGGTESSQ